jgi:hypothetical protein
MPGGRPVVLPQFAAKLVTTTGHGRDHTSLRNLISKELLKHTNAEAV